MIAKLFHHWERRLVSVTTDRVVRPFEWGLDWIPSNSEASGLPPDAILADWVDRVMSDTESFFHVPSTDDYQLDGETLTFPSAYVSPHPQNNVVRVRYFPARRHGAPRARRAVLVLPHWNAQEDAHVGLCRVLARVGISALRLSLPYHDQRMPPELHRADYVVSSNVGRTVQVCRQAVLDSRRAIAWLDREGYDRIGILGTSLGSCLALLTMAHEPLIRAAAFNHISPFFADVVWDGLSTAHVRAGLEGSIELDRLRALWLPISPLPYLERLSGKKILLVYARYDLSFPVALSRMLVDECRRVDVSPEVFVLPCGHYSTGIAPFSWIDGFVLIRFLRRRL